MPKAIRRLPSSADSNLAYHIGLSEKAIEMLRLSNEHPGNRKFGSFLAMSDRFLYVPLPQYSETETMTSIAHYLI